ncbi:acyltransferase family protein [Mycobacterium sp. MAA66]|uniref:acyltransferase family protein n=1 Tax=Mycobacterium sp. MAA66 TaxID=3156297 RepID=UPI0035111025
MDDNRGNVHDEIRHPRDLTNPPSRPQRPKRPDIQGLRAIAVGLVVLFHADIPGFGGGYVGVDVFFVISGFLISTHLMEGLREKHRIGFAAFYARRARRLLPAALTVIIATVAASAIWASPVQFGSVVNDAIAAAFYVPNFAFAATATDYLTDKTPSLLLHFWSLGVEEQFYLLWPLLLLFLFRWFGLRIKMAAAMGTLTALSFGLCIWLTRESQPDAFFLLPSRVWEFGFGAIVALILLNGRRALPDRLAAAAGWIGLAGIIGAGTLFSPATAYPGSAVAVPVVCAALLIAAGATPHGPVALLGRRPFTWTGDISYSLYLVHWPALMLPLAATGYLHPLPMWLRGLIAALCIPAAWLLYTYVEQPGQRFAWLTAARPRRTLGVAAAGMACVTGVALLGAAVLHPPLNAGRPADPTMLVADPIGTPFVPSNLTPTLITAHDDLPSINASGCMLQRQSADPTGCRVGANSAAPRVVLFGDSHAAQWYPALAALADKGVIRLESHTKTACPPAAVPGAYYPQCDTWRRTVIHNIAAGPPALVLLAGYARLYLANDDRPTQRWRDAMSATVAQLPRRSQIAIIADTPSTGVNPSLCLGRFVNNADRCALPRAAAVYPDARRAEQDIVSAGQAGYLDYVELFCNATTCPGILGNTLVYRDGTHITATVSTKFADILARDLQRLLGGQQR